MRKFNVSGIYLPNMHYVVNISDKVEDIIKMIDLVIDFLKKQFIIELKIWYGENRHEEAYDQLAKYLKFNYNRRIKKR